MWPNQFQDNSKLHDVYSLRRLICRQVPSGPTVMVWGVGKQWFSGEHQGCRSIMSFLSDYDPGTLVVLHPLVRDSDTVMRRTSSNVLVYSPAQDWLRGVTDMINGVEGSYEAGVYQGPRESALLVRDTLAGTATELSTWRHLNAIPMGHLEDTFLEAVPYGALRYCRGRRVDEHQRKRLAQHFEFIGLDELQEKQLVNLPVEPDQQVMWRLLASLSLGVCTTALVRCLWADEQTTLLQTHNCRRIHVLVPHEQAARIAAQIGYFRDAEEGDPVLVEAPPMAQTTPCISLRGGVGALFA